MIKKTIKIIDPFTSFVTLVPDQNCYIFGVTGVLSNYQNIRIEHLNVIAELRRPMNGTFFSQLIGEFICDTGDTILLNKTKTSSISANLLNTFSIEASTEKGTFALEESCIVKSIIIEMWFTNN